MTDERVLSIDFGASTTVAMLATIDGPARPVLFDGTPLLPSGVCADEAGVLHAGRDALHLARLDPARFEPSPKRRIDDGSVLLGDREWPVAELVAAVLRRVVAETTRQVQPVPPAVLTCPADWGPVRRGVLGEAASRAGLRVLAFVEEPVAAAACFVAVLGHQLPTSRSLVVFDFGAGTLDVAVLRRTGEDFRVVASAGVPDLGGADLDGVLVDLVGTRVPAEVWDGLVRPATPEQQRERLALWEDARSAKEILSRSVSVAVRVPGGPDSHLTRDEFEERIGPLLGRAMAATTAALRSAGTRPDELAGVFLVGGSSRIPLVGASLHRMLGVAPTVPEQPELAVAAGALHTGAVPRISRRLAHALRPASPASPAGPAPVPLVARSRWPAVLAAVLVALLLAGGLAAYLARGGSPGTGPSATGSSGTRSPSAGGGSASSGMVLTRTTPGRLARTAPLQEFVAGWDSYPDGWRCGNADRAHKVGLVGLPASYEPAALPEQSIYCVQGDLEAYFGYFTADAGIVTGAYQNAGSQVPAPTPESYYDPNVVLLDSWPGGGKALVWNGISPPHTIGIIATQRLGTDLRLVWRQYAPH